jgi:hypothetical protein
MVILLLIWLAVGIGLLLLGIQRRGHSAGLPLAYFLGLSLIHVPGASLYLDSEEWGSIALWTRKGFEQTVIGMVAFLIAVMIARYIAFRRRPGPEASIVKQNLTTRSVAALDRLALIYLSIGAVAYFVLLPVLGGLATVTAVIASLGSLVVIGGCLWLWVARENRNRFRFWSTIALLPLLPLATVVQGGFIGFGTYWILAIVAFVFAQSKRRLGYFLLAPVVIFVGLSVFVDYMAVRTDIRQMVWYQQTPVEDRIQGIAEKLFENFEWVDLSNFRHRIAIDNRLNQNWFVGLAMARLESGKVEYAYGATLGDMIIGLIPRAIWPEKPATGGGGQVVRNLTGIKVAQGTSFGAGQVLEFYANFGTLGVIGGFLLYGLLFGWMDLRIIESLRQGDQGRFLFRFLICVALLQPGSNLLEIFVGSAASAITGYAMWYIVNLRRPLGNSQTSRRTQQMWRSSGGEWSFGTDWVLSQKRGFFEGKNPMG